MSAHTEPEQFLYDLIKFCLKWGLWEEMYILSNGWIYAGPKADLYEMEIRGLIHSPEEADNEIRHGFRDLEEIRMIRSDAEQSHMFTLYLSERLWFLLVYCDYTVMWDDLSKESQWAILEADHYLDKFVVDPVTGLVVEIGPDGLPSSHDELEFDTYEEFQEYYLNEYVDPREYGLPDFYIYKGSETVAKQRRKELLDIFSSHGLTWIWESKYILSVDVSQPHSIDSVTEQTPRA